jgi:hypothetical protein
LPAIDTPAATIADREAPGLRGEPSGDVNDQPQVGNADPGNNGLGHQFAELPNQAALHAAEDIPPVTAGEDANGGLAAHTNGTAAEHAPTIDTPATTVADSAGPGVRGDPPGQVNDQPQLGNADPGDNGLGHQSAELPSLPVAHAVAEIPSASDITLPDDVNSPALPNAGADGKADNAPDRAAAADPSQTIGTEVASVAHLDSSGLAGVASGDPIDQFHFAYENPSASQSVELPSQATSHLAADILVSTADNSANDRANDFSSPALPTAGKDANGGDAAHVEGAAAKDSSTTDIADTTVADYPSSSFQGAASGIMNDQFHFANATPGSNGLSHQSLELATQPASQPAVDVPAATTELAQIIDHVLTEAAQAHLDPVTTPGQDQDVAWTNVHNDKQSSHFIIHA